MKDRRNSQGLTEEEFLKQYNPGNYERPSMSVDMLIFTVTDVEEENYRKLPDKELQVLLIKRGNHPFLGNWALPGGFVSIDESLDDAALRELKEETGIDNIYMEQLYTWGDVDRDPRTRVISCSYMAMVNKSLLKVKPGDDAQDTRWFTVKDTIFQEHKNITDGGYVYQKWVRLDLEGEGEELSAVIKITEEVDGKVTKLKSEIVKSKGLAFDHPRMIQYGLERLRNKIEYTDIAFHLMPDLFTLKELQQVYEVILDIELLTPNFRRKISKMVLETNEYKREAGHRPAKFYRYNPDWIGDAF